MRVEILWFESFTLRNLCTCQTLSFPVSFSHAVVKLHIIFVSPISQNECLLLRRIVFIFSEKEGKK